MHTLQKDVYKKPEPDVERLKNKIMEIMRSIGGGANIQFPMWLSGATSKDFKTKTVGNVKTQDKEVMWRARGHALCTLRLGVHWTTLKVVGPNDNSLTFEMSSSFNDQKKLYEEVNARIVEDMLTSLLDNCKVVTRELASARKAYVRL